MNENIENAAYDLWLIAQEHIYNDWTFETDPVNLQPQVRPLNRRVAEFIRKNNPSNIPQEKIERALNINDLSIYKFFGVRDNKNYDFKQN